MDERSIKAYIDEVRNTLAFLKNTHTIQEAYTKGFPIGGDAYAIPLCELHYNDDALIHNMAKWRDTNPQAFPSRFNVTFEGTKRWIREQVLDNPGRMLWIVVDPYGIPFGHYGIANALDERRWFEVDCLLKGQNPPSKTARIAWNDIIDWAVKAFRPEKVYSRALESNPVGVNYFTKHKYKTIHKIPLRRVFTDTDTWNLVYRDDDDTLPPDDNYVWLEYDLYASLPKRETILTAGPSVGPRECTYTLDAAQHGWNDNWKHYIERFETAFAEYLGVKHAMTTSSCTGALHLALLALDIGPGDEVIVPDLTWVATANAVTYVGATPIFADIQPDSWCLDPDSFESKITERTKAVIPVHLYGHPADMDRIMDIAKAHNLRVVEDAAPAVGAECRGRKVGTYGDFAAFSFQGAKLIVTGEGGMLVTNDTALYERVHKIWDQGRVPGTFWIDEPGWKYKMSNMQAAFGLAQLERVDYFIDLKRRLFDEYKKGLEGVPHIRLNDESDWARSIYWMTSITISNEAPLSRDELIQALNEKGIDSRPMFPAISQYPVWPDEQESQPVSMDIGNRTVNLPSGACLFPHEIAYVCDTLREILT